MSCCKSQFVVTSASTATAGFVTLTVNRAFDSIGDDAPFRLCIMKDQIPQNNTSQIQLTDGTVTLVCYMSCTGNFLRADSLRRFLCRDADGCCCTFDFHCFRGDDPAHVTFLHRFCPSSFEDPNTVT